MTYSVVVPTRDRPALLERCLAAVSEAAPGAEVVVVDDGSADAPAVEVAARRHGAVLVRTSRAGAAAARNAGARRATTEIVLLTDDDCVPERGWGDALAARVAASPPLTIVGGRTQPGPSAFVRASQSVIATVERATPFCATSNVGCHRQTLLAVPFDESFREASGEDRDWCARVLEAGGGVVHEPRALLLHLPAAGARAFWRRHVRYGRGGRRLRHRSVPAAAGLGLRVVGDGFAAGPVVGVLVVVAQLATLVGYVAGRPPRVSGARGNQA